MNLAVEHGAQHMEVLPLVPDVRFPFGQLVFSMGAAETLVDHPTEVYGILARHSQGDWGDLGDSDKDLNERALMYNSRLLSAYESTWGKIWVITEADRSRTTVLLPNEY